MSVPSTAETTNYVGAAIEPNGRGEDAFWDIAKKVERWWMTYKRNNRMYELPKREQLDIKISHYDYTEVIGVIPASIWKRNTTLKVAVWNQGQAKHTGYLTYHAADSIYQFSEAKPS